MKNLGASGSLKRDNSSTIRKGTHRLIDGRKEGKTDESTDVWMKTGFLNVFNDRLQNSIFSKNSGFRTVIILPWIEK